jgi:hypothetical protein
MSAFKIGDTVLCVSEFNTPGSPKVGATYVVDSVGDGCGCDSRIKLKGVASYICPLGSSCARCLSYIPSEVQWWSKRFIKLSEEGVLTDVESFEMV